MFSFDKIAYCMYDVGMYVDGWCWKVLSKRCVSIFLLGVFVYCLYYCLLNNNTTRTRRFIKRITVRKKRITEYSTKPESIAVIVRINIFRPQLNTNW